MKQEALFIGHGAPLNVLWNTDYKKNLQQFAKKIVKPVSIVVVSAHWEENVPLQITYAGKLNIIYDYYGFPEEMYKLTYDTSGNPALAKRIAQKLENSGIHSWLNPQRGLDHGAWIPLKIMFPNADIPILQITLPVPRQPEDLFKIGSILQPFREQGIMFLGSGNLVHNLPHVFNQMKLKNINMNSYYMLPTEEWAQETDKFIGEKLENAKYQELLHAKHIVPHFRKAAPTTEHFDPIFFILGTLESNEGVTYIHKGFEGGSVSMRCFSSET